MKVSLSLWYSGFVQRWHANAAAPLRQSGDTTGWHQQRVAMLICMLHPNPSKELIVSALTHDSAEAIVGDMPSPAKQGIIGEAISAIEDMVLEGYGVSTACGSDAAWLKFCDRLDALMWVKMHCPTLLSSDEWQASYEGVMVSAANLGVADKVKELV